MTALSAVREKLAAIADLDASRADEAAAMARDALAVLDRYLERQRQSAPRILAEVNDSCITRCEDLGGGAYDMRARLGTHEVREYVLGDQEKQSDQTIHRNARASILDSLCVEIVSSRVSEASDGDLLDALDAAERCGFEDVGEIKAAAHDCGLRMLSGPSRSVSSRPGRFGASRRRPSRTAPVSAVRSSRSTNPAKRPRGSRRSSASPTRSTSTSTTSPDAPRSRSPAARMRAAWRHAFRPSRRQTDASRSSGSTPSPPPAAAATRTRICG